MKHLLLLLSVTVMGFSASAKKEVTWQKQLKDDLHYFNVGLPMDAVYSSLHAQYSKGEVDQFIIQMKKLGVTGKEKIPKVTFKNMALYVDGIKGGLKIVSAKNAKVSFQGQLWQYQKKKTIMANILSLQKVLAKSNQAMVSIFPKAYAKEKRPVSLGRNLTTSIGSTGATIALLMAIGGASPAGLGITGAFLAASTMWAGIYWAGSELLESYRSGSISSTCINGKLHFKTKAKPTPMNVRQFLRLNDNMSAEDRETVHRHIDRYGCDPTWVEQYLNAFADTIGIDSAEASERSAK